MEHNIEAIAASQKAQDAYGSEDDLTVTHVDLEAGTLVLSLSVAAHHLNSAGTLDEGMALTMVDNYTTYLLVAHTLAKQPGDMPISVSVCLSARAFAPVPPGTPVELVCQVGNGSATQPVASAVFRNANDPSVIYATASHTKHIKDVLGYASGKL
ncbi:hypothetical protein GGI07_001710 [Coemansia sp. Benny D115]|nr:hypothetical protein GGI07_001710 [Coemansia sp. Benny D115]